MTEKIRAIIVDDESIARMAIRGVIEEHFPEIYIQAEVKNVPEAVKEINKLEPDIIFLDIEMPGHSGLELLDFFEDRHLVAKIIFVTAYEEFALRAFEMAAVDYILKPVSKKQIERALSRISPLNGKYLEVLRENLTADQPKKITITSNEGLLVLKLEDILYLKADGSYTHFMLVDGSKTTTSKRLSEYQRIMAIGNFQRIYRSHIVNVNHIKKIGRDSGDYVLLTNGDELPLSSDRKPALMAAFKNLHL
jgi:two-component system LytT family response regulator